ncbi:MAG TPA: hypothetical protein VJL35_11910 [Gemmatimonadaceae bacterium]|nr:hypothetical protein [Gemmatimonadaceae bacterium]
MPDGVRRLLSVGPLRHYLQIGLALATLGMACATVPSIPVSVSDAPSVVIGRTSARFIFPRESTSVLSWDIPTHDSYKGSPEHVWSASWEISEERLGKDPDGVSVAVRFKNGVNRKGSLSQMLTEAETTVNTTCMQCDIPAYTPTTDAAVTASAIDGRVVITVKGSAAIQRLFPVIPDSIYLERYAPHGNRTGFWKVAVRRQ